MVRNYTAERRMKLPLLAEASVLFRIWSAKGTAQLDFRESEFIAEFIGGAHKPFQLFAAPGVEQIHLSRRARAGRKRSQRHAHEPQLGNPVPRRTEKIAQRCVECRVQIRRRGERPAAR